MTDEEFYTHFRKMKNHSKTLQALKQIKYDEILARQQIHEEKLKACTEEFYKIIPKKYDKKFQIASSWNWVTLKWEHFRIMIGIGSIEFSEIVHKNHFKFKTKQLSKIDFEQVLNQLDNLLKAQSVVDS